MKERGLMFKAPMVRAILDGRKTQTRRVINPQPPTQPEANCHPSHTWLHAEPYLDAYRNAERTTANPRGMSENWCWWQVDDRQCLPTFRSPFGKPGDRIWVRETWKYDGWSEDGEPLIRYAADNNAFWMPPSEAWADRVNDIWAALSSADNLAIDGVARDRKWRPSLLMPRWASRITLEITNVRVERLQAISEADAIAEGLYLDKAGRFDTYSATKESREHFSPVCAYEDLWRSIYDARPTLPSNPNSKRYARVKRWLDTHPDTASWDANPWVWVYEFKRVTTT